MSVRVTERLIGDVVIASGLPNSPKMIVQTIDEQAKMVTTTWFSDNHECQEGLFPGSAIDRVEAPQAHSAKKSAAQTASKEKNAAPGRRGRPKAVK
ncbi:MAG: hypothetical protein FWC45_08365 [Treponema sp.]|nr:hypothetical protein [Treponema sp.]